MGGQQSPPQAGQQQPAAPFPAAPKVAAKPWSHLTPQHSIATIHEMGLDERIDRMLNAGNSPETIGRALQGTLNSAQKNWYADKLRSGEVKPLIELVGDYFSQKQDKGAPQPPPINPLVPKDVVSIPQTGQPPEVSQAPNPEPIYADPKTGIAGPIKHTGDKQVLIEQDGNLHKAEKEDIAEIPEPLQAFDYKEMARKYKDTFPLKGPGSLSTNVAFLAHHAPSKELWASFVTAPTFIYRYSNVPTELYDRIKSQSVAPKTSGTGFLGEWDVADADSIGGPFHEIRKNAEKYPYDKIPVGYNMMENLLAAISELEKEHAKQKRAAQKRQV